MDKNIIKSGSCSIVLGSNYYKPLIKIKKNKLLKLTLMTEKHNEFKYLKNIKEIKNYDKYFVLPDETKYLLQPTDVFYKNIKQIVAKTSILCDKPLYYFYVDYAGDKELIDTIEDLINYHCTNYWTSYKKILKFTKKILEGLTYLHMKKICHLDIKPENIIINTITNKYKIIDFGFASIEPFDDYVFSLKGTPGYFPQNIKNDKIKPWLPKILANDTIPVNGVIPMRENRQLVYKIDSYCFGRLLYYLKYMYDEYKEYKCFTCKKDDEIKLCKIIDLLLEKNVYKRLSIINCYNNII
jgi:serine/threonine protein kinase